MLETMHKQFDYTRIADVCHMCMKMQRVRSLMPYTGLYTSIRTRALSIHPYKNTASRKGMSTRQLKLLDAITRSKQSS